ncbi:MAG: ABC transporter substrate-binding protein [Gemmatimonadota bacterium]
MRRLLGLASSFALGILLATGCGRGGECPNCGTVVVVAVGEPSSLFPPLTFETVGRDIGDLVYERLADLIPGRATVDEGAYAPALATKWERVDSLTWRFTLRSGARWHDGTPVTPADVRFSFEVYADSVLDPPGRSSIAENIAGIESVDSTGVLVRFKRWYPEQLYDATYHVRIIPEQVWASITPRDAWAEDTATAHLMGSGPYRIDTWQRGQSLTLRADTTREIKPDIRRLVWRFTQDPEAAANLMLSHEGDLLETAAQAGADRLVNDSSFRLLPYPSAVYGLVGFRIAGTRRRPSDEILSNREVRRALVAGVDRTAIARGVFGPETKVPPGPISQLLWIWDTGVTTIAFDTVAAARELDAAGWTRKDAGFRRKNGHPLKLEIMVPSSSSARRRAAEAIQAQWKSLGVDASVAAVELPVMQQRLERGDFDTYIGAWLDEPTPRGLGEQWSRHGWTDLNYGHYANPVLDSLIRAAGSTADPGEARKLWHQVLDSLNADAPAIFLFAPTNIAAVSRRLDLVDLNAYSWLSGLPRWKLKEGR